MQKTEIIQNLINFAEGKMSFDEFLIFYTNDVSVKNLLNDDNPGKRFSCFRERTVDQHMHIYNWNTRQGRNIVHLDIVRYLEYYGYKFTPTKKYENEYAFLLEIQPRYVNIEDEQFLQSLIDGVPKDISKAQQKKWLKAKIKNLFCYDKIPPHWIQDPEWPIIQGKPLVFKTQTRLRKDDERVFYIFYDSETKEETIVEQFY